MSLPKTMPASDAPPLVNTVRVCENGPLAVEAALQINGETQTSARATLCRCGRSAHKPFCDGNHQRSGFVATGEPPDTPFDTQIARAGPLDLQPVPNGPLHFVGPLALVSSSGRTFNRVKEVWLCRCGQSKNKPYCDGSHKAAGFTTP